MSVPTVVTVIQGFRAQLLNREQAAMQEAARRWLQVEQALGAQIEATTLQLIANGDFSISQAMRSRRWLSLMEQTRDELRKYRDYMEPRITNGQRTLATQAIGHSATAINAVATEAQIVVPFNRLPMSAVESMIGLAGDGSPLRDVLQDACNAGADAMGQQLVNGVALGLNPREVARRAMRLGLGQSFTRMQTIARTEQLRVYRLTSLESYRNSRVVVAYRRLSARDRRTCFVAGTLVATPEGDKPIELICIGDTVLTHLGPRRVASVMVRPYTGDLVTYHRGGNATTCTPSHAIWVGRGSEYKWLPAEMLRSGDKLMLAEQVDKHLAGNGGNRSGSFPTKMDRAIPLPGEKGIAPSFLGGVLMPVPTIGFESDVVKQNEVDSVATGWNLFAIRDTEFQERVFASDFERSIAGVRSVAVRGAEVIAVNNFTRATAELLSAVCAGEKVRRAAAFLRTINPLARARSAKFFTAPSAGKIDGFFGLALHRANYIPLFMGRSYREVFATDRTRLSNSRAGSIVAFTRAIQVIDRGRFLKLFSAMRTGMRFPIALKHAAALCATTQGIGTGSSSIFEIRRRLFERLTADGTSQLDTLASFVADGLTKAFRRTIGVFRALDSRRMALDRSAADGAIDCNHASIISLVRNRPQVKTTVYDLEVEDAHTYFANGALVHNCPACLFADGQQYPIEYGFDEHPAGRCTMIPVLVNVPRIEYPTGQSWFRSQDESTQLAILGRGRFDLWRRGEASLDDMVSRDWSDTWGGSLRVTRVRDLG